MNESLSPHLALRLAVLCRAILDYCGDIADIRDRRSAYVWFTTRNIGGLDFVEVCEDLDLDADSVRQKVLSHSAGISEINLGVVSFIFKLEETSDFYLENHLSFPERSAKRVYH